MKHSETPWSCELSTSDSNPNAIIKNENIYLAQTVGGNDNANAAFIVKAVNNHYQLLEALKAARVDIAGYPRSLGYGITSLPNIDKAIEEAK